MAEAKEPKTTKVYVRLTRDFPAGVSHRRGPVVLQAGPVPVEVDATDEDLALFDEDHYVEIVDKEEADKWAAYKKDEPTHPTSDELKGSASGNDSGNGRDYGDAPELSTNSKLADLQAYATEIGVEDADKLRSKQAVLDAIEAKKAETSEEE